MIKRIGLLLLPFLFLGLVTVKSAEPQTVSISNNETVYDLPYPGILPDHPLYFLKAGRDKILDIVTFDPLKKAQLYLLFSDKRVNAAQSLKDKGRTDLAITTLSKGEKYSLKIPDRLKDAKKNNEKIDRDLLDKVKLSNAKHKEIIEEFLKELPEGDQQRITEILKINSDVKKGLQGL